MGADGGADPLALHLADVRKTDGAFVEQSGRNQSQPVAKRDGHENGSQRRKPLPWAATACRRVHGKEGIDGSSPSEGFTKFLQIGLFW